MKHYFLSIVFCAAFAASAPCADYPSVAAAQEQVLKVAQLHALRAQRKAPQARGEDASAKAPKAPAQAAASPRAASGGALASGKGELFDENLTLAVVYAQGMEGFPVNFALSEFFARKALSKTEFSPRVFMAMNLLAQNTPYSNARALNLAAEGILRSEEDADLTALSYFRSNPAQTPYEKLVCRMCLEKRNDSGRFASAKAAFLSWKESSDPVYGAAFSKSLTNAGVADFSSGAERAAELRARAEHGDADAAFVVAMLYVKGQGLAKDKKQAFYFCGLSADEGNLAAQVTFGTMCFLGEGSSEDNRRAIGYLRRAAEKGSFMAGRTLSMMLDGAVAGVPADEAERLKWQKWAADKGDHALQCKYGMHLMNAEKYREGVAYLERAAEAGDDEAALVLYIAYTKDLGGWGTPERGGYWILRAFDSGAPFEFYAAEAYRNGWGVPQDFAAAGRYYDYAARFRKDAQAQLALASLYERGEGAERDLGHALYWLKCAAENGSQEAARRLQDSKWNGVAEKPAKYFNIDESYLRKLEREGGAAVRTFMNTDTFERFVRAAAPREISAE